MHVLQRIAVVAEDKNEAFYRVKDYLENELNNYQPWYDWFVTGGGRWNENTDGYDDNDQSMTISYAEEPDKFVEAINEAIECRKQEFTSYMRDIDFNGIQDKLLSFDGTIDYSFGLYPLSKAIDIMQGKWDFNSYFFDAHHDSTNPKHMLDKLDGSWYLVFVDFHF